MIRRIEFENFMSLKNCRVDFEPLTIFIGPNASGKSAIFKGLVTLSKLLSGAPVRGPKGEFYLEDGVTLDDLVWGGNSGLSIKFRVWFLEDTDDNNPGYSLELAKRPEGWSVTHERIRTENGWIYVDEDHPFEHQTERFGNKSLKPPMRASLCYLVHPFANDSAARPMIEPIISMGKRFGLTWRYRPSASDIASFVQRSAETKTFFVQENGRGLALVLQELQGSKRDVFLAIEKEVCRLFPHIKTIGFKSDRQGTRLAYMTNRSEDPIPAPQESDGVLLATFTLWRLYTAGQFLKICLEEPEGGLHPYFLGDRYQLLKKFAYPEESRPSVQILVATHSRDFLRTLKTHPATLFPELRIVDFDLYSGTSVKKLSHYREVHNLFEKYGNIGDLWSSGEMGGVPAGVQLELGQP